MWERGKRGLKDGFSFSFLGLFRGSLIGAILMVWRVHKFYCKCLFANILLSIVVLDCNFGSVFDFFDHVGMLKIVLLDLSHLMLFVYSLCAWFAIH